jgi:diguanylate cyclase (GGDEF)-like protein
MEHAWREVLGTVKRFSWHRAVKRVRRILAVAWKKPRRIASDSNTRLRKRFVSPRASIARLGIITTCTIIFAPPILYAVLSAQQLQQRAMEHASVGARHVEVQLTNGSAVDRLNEVSTSVLHATAGADSSVTATWVTDIRGTTLMFQGQSAWWPEFWARAPIRATNFEGHFSIAISTGKVFVGTLAVSSAFLLLGLAAYYCFRRLPLAALDDALGQLHAKQLNLASQNDRLRQQEEELRSQNMRFNTAVNNMSQGLAMFDAEQRLIVCNRLYWELYGLTPEQVRPGTTIRQLLEYRHAKGVFGNVDFETFVRDWLAEFSKASSRIQELADGRVISVVRRPMLDGGLVSTTEDVTERQKLNALLEQQNLRFDVALKNMSHGLCMVDAEHRVLIANDRYAEMYGLTPEQVKPGTTLRQIIEHRIAKGLYAGANPEEYLNERLAVSEGPCQKILKLSDGRTIANARQPMPGGGWVFTHDDITEREKLHERLDAALNNMVQGLAMFDAEQRLVVCNNRYAEIYGLTPEQVKPGTTLRQILEHRIANGHVIGKTADEMLNWMLSRVPHGKEAGHYTSQLRDGRYIAVAVQPMADGGTVTTHQDMTEQRRSEAKIAHMALHDALTGLPNRVLLNERLEHALARVKRGEMVATHLLDLDHFKNVNDTLGHPAGDKLLQMVTDRLRALVRETDTIARMGGDEFAILQVAIAQPSDATSLAQRIIEVVSEPYDIDGQQVIIGTSVGIAVGPTDGLNPDQLMRNADLALYRAKGGGRGMYRFFEPEMDAQMQARRDLEYDLRKALVAGEFELHYQPVVNLESNAITGFEALLRWRHPERGMLSPGAFIPLAEEIGLIIPLGEWVLRNACATAASWPDDLKVAVNLSPAQFRSPGLVQIVVGALAASGLPAGRLELEITETVLLEDKEATLATLYQLRGLGVGIAMDDFGTGYSSLSYLQSFPFDRIKIDQSFVKDINDTAGSLNIVRAVAALANGLGMTSTAEGVETKEQLDTVKSEGCTDMQGFLFSPPRPVHEIEQLFLSKHKDRKADAADAA